MGDDSLRCFETVLLPFVKQKIEASGARVGTDDTVFSEPVRSFFRSEPVIQRWLNECCPLGKFGYRLAIGCDTLTVADLETEYSQTEQAQDLVDKRMFVFAVDGSGWGYTLNLQSGKVYLLAGAWGGETDTSVDQAIRKEWDSLAAFVDELKSRD